MPMQSLGYCSAKIVQLNPVEQLGQRGRLQLCLKQAKVLQEVKLIPQLDIKGHGKPFLKGIVGVQ